MRANLERGLAALMTVAVLIAGVVHLKLYNDGYKDVPVGHIGAQFLLNAVAAATIAIGLVLAVVTRLLPGIVGWVATLGGLAWAGVSLLAFYLARTSHGWFGFTDQPGLHPSPEAALAVYSEAATIILGVALLAAHLAKARRLG